VKRLVTKRQLNLARPRNGGRAEAKEGEGGHKARTPNVPDATESEGKLMFSRRNFLL